MIKISKGLDLPISGIPEPIITDTPKVTSVSLLGNDFTGMKPTKNIEFMIENIIKFKKNN